MLNLFSFKQNYFFFLLSDSRLKRQLCFIVPEGVSSPFLEAVTNGRGTSERDPLPAARLPPRALPPHGPAQCGAYFAWVSSCIAACAGFSPTATREHHGTAALPRRAAAGRHTRGS